MRSETIRVIGRGMKAVYLPEREKIITKLSIKNYTSQGTQLCLKIKKKYFVKKAKSKDYCGYTVYLNQNLKQFGQLRGFMSYDRTYKQQRDKRDHLTCTQMSLVAQLCLGTKFSPVQCSFRTFKLSQEHSRYSYLMQFDKGFISHDRTY